MLIIPAVDIQGGKCVRLSQGRLGTTTVYSDDPVKVGCEWASLGAERLHVVDLDGAFTGNPQNLALVQEIIKSCGIPVQVGGGIRSIKIMQNLVKSGAYMLILGSKVASDPYFIKNACSAFPGKVMASIDAKKGRVLTQGWTEGTDQSAVSVAQRVIDLGVQMIVYTDVERDGMLSGPNLPIHTPP